MAISIDAEKKLIQLFSDFKLQSAYPLSKCKAILLGRPELHPGTKFKNPEDLFKSLGAQDVDSLDVSDFEGANIIHDMNTEIPRALEGKYSLVYDNGTMEHCFDIKQFLFNANAMLKTGGLIFHSNPLNNFINHGFYTFSPCLYLGFYLKNNFKLLDLTITGTKKYFHKEKPSEYHTFCEYSFRGKDLISLINTPRLIFEKSQDPSSMWMISFLGRKQSNSLTSSMPQQPIYDSDLKKILPKQGIMTVK